MRNYKDYIMPFTDGVKPYSEDWWECDALRKLCNEEKLTRAQKDYIFKQTENTICTPQGTVACLGWRFDFRPFMKRFLYKRYGVWREVWSFDKTAIRNGIYGRIDMIVEL